MGNDTLARVICKIDPKEARTRNTYGAFLMYLYRYRLAHIMDKKSNNTLSESLP
jgi:Tfp pilus assembly protein PilF